MGLPGPDINPIQAVISESGKCSVFVPFCAIQVSNLVIQGSVLEEEFLDVLKKVYGTGYAFCPGINCKNVETKIPFPKSITAFKYPFERVQSVNCPVWYQRNIKQNTLVQCQMCRTSRTNLVTTLKRKKLNQSPSRHMKRLKADSKYSIGRLTPKSKKKRLQCIKSKRYELKKRVLKLESQLSKRDMMLVDEQSRDLENIVTILNENHREDLEKVFAESGDDHQILKQAWKRDSEARHKSDVQNFYDDQKFCEEGFKGNRWSSITLRIALAIYSRSPGAYEALRSFNILKLPSTDTVQNKANKFNSPPGLNHNYMQEQEDKYNLMKVEKESLKQLIPKGEGVLIFDEVKVIEKIMWNSRNHQFMGFAMNSEEYPFLNDVLQNKEEPSPTQYILQFLWRDMTSNFDLIGPYFTFSSTVESKFLMGCILETIKGLQAYSFKTIGLVCDGASENLSTIKLSMGVAGAFGHNVEIFPSFDNPFCPIGSKIFWVICPSHELKSMVSALHSSRVKGTKDFNRNGIFFGWKQIEEVKQRDEERFKKGLLRSVPKLVKSFVIRDAWTRLNVQPSKIMQQEEVLGELFGHAHGTDGTKASRESAHECYKYLNACHKLFEKGLLSKEAIHNIKSPTITSMSEGLQYFLDWLQEIQTTKPDVTLTSTKQTLFLSWQTWDLLRISVVVFRMMCKDFLNRNPGYFISPVRVNGSALESLFAQLKYSTASKLSGINYTSTRKSVLIKRNVHGSHVSNKNYRDVPLYIRESDV